MVRTTIIAEPGTQSIVLSSVFEAPRSLVFDTFTDPKQTPLWWGPKYLTIIVDRMEVRKGGMWRLVQRDPDGNKHAINGVYHKIPPRAGCLHL